MAQGVGGELEALSERCVVPRTIEPDRQLVGRARPCVELEKCSHQLGRIIVRGRRQPKGLGVDDRQRIREPIGGKVVGPHPHPLAELSQPEVQTGPTQSGSFTGAACTGRHDPDVPLPHPRRGRGPKTGLLTPVTVEKVTGEFVDTAIEARELPAIDHSRQRHSRRARLYAEFAGERNQQAAGKTRRHRAEKGRRHDAARRERRHRQSSLRQS